MKEKLLFVIAYERMKLNLNSAKFLLFSESFWYKLNDANLTPSRGRFTILHTLAQPYI